MTITINLQPEIELGLLAQAQAHGVSLTEYVLQIVAREAKPVESLRGRTGQELVAACASVSGLLSDEEIDTVFSRTLSTSRPVDVS